MLNNRKRELMIIFGVALVGGLLPLGVPDFVRYLVVLVSIYGIASLGLNIFMGYCGQINLGSAGFFCMGAYIPTMLQVKYEIHYLIGFPLAVLISTVVAWLLSYPLLRLKGHAMAIGTLSFGMAIFLIAERFPDLTGGADGISVPPMEIPGIEVGDSFYYYLILACFLLSYLVCYFLMESRIGRALKAIRDDEDAASALGINVDHYKRFAWVVNNGLMSVAGALFAQQAGFLSPSTFALWTSISVLVMICVGGLGTNLGSVIGAAIMTLLPYILVSIQEYIMLTQGLILFSVLRFMPDGIVGTLPKLLRRKVKSKQALTERAVVL
ncbi:MAG TPA: branched-chain amino acid ABC transporter permease [Geobacteraceae bacterium]|nr:branched-chain amino acid ABC transporter permease [Geobacteraceae bacterium]